MRQKTEYGWNKLSGSRDIDLQSTMKGFVALNQPETVTTTYHFIVLFVSDGKISNLENAEIKQVVRVFNRL